MSEPFGYQADRLVSGNEAKTASESFEGINLSNHCLEICAQESIDLSVLKMLTTEEMEMLSFKFGDRRKIERWQSEQRKLAHSNRTKPPETSTKYDDESAGKDANDIASFQPTGSRESNLEAHVGGYLPLKAWAELEDAKTGMSNDVSAVHKFQSTASRESNLATHVRGYIPTAWTGCDDASVNKDESGISKFQPTLRASSASNLGAQDEVNFEKLTFRILKLTWRLSDDLIPAEVVKQVRANAYAGMTTSQLVELAAEKAAGLAILHPDYGLLAARIIVSSLHENTEKRFSKNISKLRNNVDTRARTGKPDPLIAEDVYNIVMHHAERLDSAIIHNRDFDYNYIDMRTLAEYLLKINGKITESPQHMLMRVAVGIHKNDIDRAIDTYNYMSQNVYTHALPTMCNAGTPHPELSSRFLVSKTENSIIGINNTLEHCATSSKIACGIGISAHNMRARGAYIRLAKVASNDDLSPNLCLFNNVASSANQGGAKRELIEGSVTIYLEPWHADIFQLLDLHKNYGQEGTRTRQQGVLYALWTSDLFMKRTETDGMWSLFYPDAAPNLHEVYGEEFEALYTRYEKEGRARKTVKARALWHKIVLAQTESGTAYMLYKDTCNRRSSHKNLGTIKSSKLCKESIEHTDTEEVFVNNLASLNLPKFITWRNKSVDHQKLYEVTYHITENLNSVIDVTDYPSESSRKACLRNRPTGISVRGLADTFALLRFPFVSEEAVKLNREIFETIYFAALTASKDLAKKHGTYETFKGSPASEGVLQFDMCGSAAVTSGRWDWAALKDEIKEHGLRNSVLIASIPTNSIPHILGSIEGVEPYTSNPYIRRALADEHAYLNRHMVRDLIKLGRWKDLVKDQLIVDNGSIRGLQLVLPDEIEHLYKTPNDAASIKMRINMAADRGAYIDQSQSVNVTIENASFAKVTSIHFHGWKQGMKTVVTDLR